MTQDIFDSLWCKLRDIDTNAVIEIDINFKAYWGYSQSVPADAPDNEVLFAIFFMKPKPYEPVEEVLKVAFKESQLIMMSIIFVLVTLMMLSVYVTIILSSRKITRPIMKLTTFTRMMNQA